MIDDTSPALSPLTFFELALTCHYLPLPSRHIPRDKALRKRYLLPHTSPLNGEEVFADVFWGWNEEGMAFAVEAVTAPLACHYPDFKKGDSFEIFLDMRPKTSAVITRYCHHFFALPEAVEGVRVGEITRFREGDSHPLATFEQLDIRADINKKGYRLELFIPAEQLYGWDSDASDIEQVAFTYRLNRFQAPAQHLSVGQDFSLEIHPPLWAIAKLIR